MDANVWSSFIDYTWNNQNYIEIPEWYIVRLESIVENLNDCFSSMIRELIVTVLDGIDAV